MAGPSRAGPGPRVARTDLVSATSRRRALQKRRPSPRPSSPIRAAAIAAAPGVQFTLTMATRSPDGTSTTNASGTIDFEKARFSGTADGGGGGAPMMLFGSPSSGAGHRRGRTVRSDRKRACGSMSPRWTHTWRRSRIATSCRALSAASWMGRRSTRPSGSSPAEPSRAAPSPSRPHRRRSTARVRRCSALTSRHLPTTSVRPRSSCSSIRRAFPSGWTRLSRRDRRRQTWASSSSGSIQRRSSPTDPVRSGAVFRPRLTLPGDAA